MLTLHILGWGEMYILQWKVSIKGKRRCQPTLLKKKQSFTTKHNSLYCKHIPVYVLLSIIFMTQLCIEHISTQRCDEPGPLVPLNTVITPPYGAPRTGDRRKETFYSGTKARPVISLIEHSCHSQRSSYTPQSRRLKLTRATCRLVGLIVWICNLRVIYHQRLNSLPMSFQLQTFYIFI